MEEYAGRVLAERYRLPRPPADEFELVESRAFDTYSGQEVLVHQVLLPEVVSAEPAEGSEASDGSRRPSGDGDDGLDESARRALEAARSAAAIPDHPRLVQVFDIFVEDGSLWIASELVSARSLAALLAERPLDAYRAAEVASDVLTALRALHATGWTHRNVTASTVLVCDDGRAMLAGLAAGAAQEALCGYDPLPEQVLAGGGEGDDWHGPRSALEQERARQNRITVVGAVTERWAPEQAHEVHENWRLSPPVGPAADLWALGSLLFRSVQGHPPYPEESAAELVQLVCAEPPAFAEECGPLRPIVESLLRPDPEERPEAEELGGWLRSLIRSAPEPDLGVSTVQVPTDPAKLPVKRRRGELVRRRRKKAAAESDAGAQHRRHARGKQARAGRLPKQARPAGPGKAVGMSSAVAAPDAPTEQILPARPARPAKAAKSARPAVPDQTTVTHSGPRTATRPHIHEEDVVYRRPDGSSDSPRRLGLRLLIAVLVILAAVVAYALLFLPQRKDSSDGAHADRTLPAGMPHPGDGKNGGGKSAGASTAPSTGASTASKPPAGSSGKPASKPPTSPSGPALGPDFVLRRDAAGFSVAVHTGWQRSGANSKDEVTYAGDDLQLTVVPGRDRSSARGTDPVAYQLNEPELADFRASSWSSASGLQSLTLDGHPAAEGEYTYRDSSGQGVYARNLAILIGGKYHIVLVTGLDSQRAAVQQAFDKAVQTYSAG
ncbi:protein kinase [Actinacidiphila yanglinensis]|uniref:protein kinase n=1 Tax=Actinacidiphila yanglinensis TaxID=310779 RepID=UPI000CDF1907|nr:protein kinase [Actinacidiphila yanglinensis]